MWDFGFCDSKVAHLDDQIKRMSFLPFFKVLL